MDEPFDRYADEYFDVVSLWEHGAYNECINTARLHLNDPTLTPYDRMKHLLLIACAQKYWDEAERYALEAERMWPDAIRAAAAPMKEWLEEIREDLDELQRTQARDVEQHELEDSDSDESEPEYYIQSKPEALQAARPLVQGSEESATMEAQAAAMKLSDLEMATEQHLRPPANPKESSDFNGLASPSAVRTATSASGARTPIHPDSGHRRRMRRERTLLPNSRCYKTGI